jgi:hypothetical protein
MSKGQAKEEVVDFLEEDDEIRGQQYVLLSFLSPEKVLQDKSRAFFTEFLKDYEVTWKTKNLEKYLADTVIGLRKTLFDEADKLDAVDLSGAAVKCRDAAKQFRVEEVLDTYQQYLKKIKNDVSVTTINEAYDEFLFKNGDKLEDDFYAKNNFRTTIRGVKVRGVYANQGEAQIRAKKLQQSDKRHDILIGDVGKWLAWDPSPHQIPSQEYANDQLNSLMKAYSENEDAREKFYTQNPDAKKAKNVKSVFNMSLQPSDAAGTSAELNATEATNTLFEGPADLALARKMEKATKIDE